MLAKSRLILCSALLLFAQSLLITTVYGDDWKPIDPSELAMKQPKVEKDADAEAIFWDVSVADEYDGSTTHTVFKHYIRIKIFTDRGRETSAKIDIPFSNSVHIDGIAGRTIKPDGSIVELKKEDVYERTLVKVGGVKVKVKSFAMPAVVPGSIIEYRYRETRYDELSDYVRLKFQRDIPVEKVTYHIKPLQNTTYGMRSQTFHGQNSPFVKERDGFYSTSMTDVPAYHEEPRMPPEYEVEPWMLLYYTEDTKLDAQKYWTKLGKDLSDIVKSHIKVNNDVKKAEAEAVGDAATPDEKLKRIYEYCQKHIKNASFRGAGATQEEREKMKENKSPADTLKRGIGDAEDIDGLFAAMAEAAGFEAREAMLPSRGDIFFNKTFTDPYFLKAIDVAVKVGESWRFYDPGSYYLPFGMLNWQEEGVPALILDSKNPEFAETPMLTAQGSLEKRTAHLRLAEDGTIEGDVRIEYGGHFATSRREEGVEQSPTEREKGLKDNLKSRMSTAEVTNVKMEGFEDSSKPIVYTYHVKVQGYAVHTGKRLFLQPAFFEHGVAATFPTSERKYPVYFHYPWSESDEVLIDLPPGFELDHADAPAPLGAGKISSYEVKIGVTKDKKMLDYRRSFFFGGGEVVLFPVTSYAPLKKLFDYIHEADGHTLSLKRDETVGK